jgi:hypothetical protein
MYQKCIATYIPMYMNAKPMMVIAVHNFFGDSEHFSEYVTAWRISQLEVLESLQKHIHYSK